MKQQIKRQESAKSRLVKQLASGVKTTKEGQKPLTDSDKERMKSEIATLEIKIQKGK